MESLSALRSRADPGSAPALPLPSRSSSATAGLRSGAAGDGPPICTGVAAPRFVAGAMAAMWLAYTRNVPALAARAPLGDTYVMTGTSDARIACTMSRMAVSRPPGVSMVTTTSDASVSAASRSLRTKKSLVAGPIGPETGSRTPLGPEGDEAPASSIQPAASSAAAAQARCVTKRTALMAAS